MQVNTDETRHIFIARQNSTGQNHNIKVLNKTEILGNDEKKNKNYFHKEIKSSLKCTNSCYYPAQNVFVTRRKF
jgi:hypothetical protein